MSSSSGKQTLPGKPCIILIKQVSSNKWKHKEEKTWCRVADESVVARNPQPMKAGNRLEEKTEGTLHLVAMRTKEPKAFSTCEGTKTNQGMQAT
ncbi:hypothetical protein Psch_02978 [Pelotomaculum schinkii]|uniref:Uncharacterized protein n=1 Tax=Pelotomaculum schinkii TaxID=78350 RepID=A0A4Y7RAV5_9FIRM|nr:hypothetical protein Psch_02978 [Pelotomaculum schinkii]